MDATARRRGRSASIVIPVFNRVELTHACLEALAAATRGDFEVIVVDNASTDDTPALLAQFAGAITVIRNAENEGFARACNAGARRAVGEHVVFLNNDTLPRPGWLDALVAAAEDPTIGAVGARLLYPDGTVQHAGIGFTPDFEPVHVHQGVVGDSALVAEDRDCEAVTGACLLVPRDVLAEVGGFDEGYRMYFEDVDLCLRIRASGRRVRYAAGSVVVHLERASSPTFDAAFALNRASRERFRARWVTPARPARAPLRVLFQARSSLLTHPGGDTVVVRRLIAGLEAEGVAARLGDPADAPSGSDVVHTINFATPETTERITERAAAAGVPVVVTALYEEWPRFLREAHAIAALLVKTVGAGTRLEPAVLAAVRAHLRAQPPLPPAKNEKTAALAAMVLACGESERRRLLADHPAIREVRVVPFGADEHGASADGAAASDGLFARTYGVRDHVLCVARLEPRKNQLMLLEALRDDPRPVVLVAGDFAWVPTYAEACRAVRRRGPTLVLGRLSSTMLAAAFREAAVHCLPSWYELPGLVSLEAALHGARLAASSWGALGDYLGDTVAWLEPDDPASIAAAVAAAATLDPARAAARARAFTWARTAAETRAAYEAVIPIARRAPGAAVAGAGASAPPSAATLLAEAERARRDGDYATALARAEAAGRVGAEAGRVGELRATALVRLGRLDEAATAFTALLAHPDQARRAALGLGVIALERADLATAESWLERATIRSADPDAWMTLGVCRARLGRHDAWDAFARARAIAPEHREALAGLIALAGEGERLGELEQHLREYLARVGDDADVRYALAGCLYAAGNDAESRREVRAVLTRAPDHALAADLARELGA